MRRPGMSGPPVLPGKNVYTLVLGNNNNKIAIMIILIAIIIS